MNNEDTLETKDNHKFDIDNTTVYITDSDDIDRPHKLVKGIYNDNTIPALYLEDETISTSKFTGSDDSSRNASFTALESYELHDDTHVYNYRGPKVSAPKN